MGNYGERAGLPERLREWTRRLGTDKTLPWIGLGIIADLNAAADEIEGIEATTPAPQPEYDL